MTSGNASLSRLWRIATFRGRLARRTALVMWLLAAISIALLLGWPWVAAAGLSAVVLGIVPCAAMCAFGMCGGKRNPADSVGGLDAGQRHG